MIKLNENIELNLEQLNEFFNRPGINKAGFCKEVSISQQYLSRVLKGKQPITYSFIAKVLPVLQRYGFNINDN